MDYDLLLSNEDLTKKGYNLLENDHLVWQGHFPSRADAFYSFREDVIEAIAQLIGKHRGGDYADKLFEAFEDEEKRKKYSKLYKAVKKACLEQAIFYLEAGDSDAMKLEELGNERPYAPKAIKALYDADILKSRW